MKRKSNGRNSQAGKSTVALVPQPHGGALAVGGTPGNAGGGRPAKIVRERCRDSFYTRIPILEKIADDEKRRADVRIAAVEKLGRFGLGTDADRAVGAQFETPEGYKFTLILGERDQPDD